ncbi:MAG: hypothetical protein ABI566_02300 [Pseudolysinimonas sp.]
MTPDQSALRAALERQAQVLVPVAADLHAAVAHPPVAPHDWHGPASDSYQALERQVRSRLISAEFAVAAALGSTRQALVQSGG